MTVGTAVSAVFAVFLLGGITFTITSAPTGGTTVNFTYSGTQSASTIRALFQVGTPITMS